MKHLAYAKASLSRKRSQRDINPAEFITIKDNVLTIPIQSGTIFEKGVNGIQITDVLAFTNEVFESLNKVCPCKENKNTIHFIQLALKEQHYRTVDRIARGVDGLEKV